MSGVPLSAKALQGIVAAVGPDVEENLVAGDEVIFRRPEGDVPELAFMDVDLILGRLELPDYG